MSLADAEVLEAHEAPEEPRTLVETAYRQLRRDIINGTHQAGQKLRVEHLKATYQVSAGTLREALALLVSDSLVVAQGQRGFRAAPMSLADLEDLTRMRTLLECEAVRESIALGKDDWEANVVSAFHKLSLAEQRLRVDPQGTFDAWEDCNRHFHEMLVAACRSQWMLRFRRLLYQQSERYRRVSATKGPPPVEVHDEHRAIFEAVMARNADLAAAMLTSHTHRALTVIRKAGLLK